jgi:plastocyanin
MRRLAVPCTVLLAAAGCGGGDGGAPSRTVTTTAGGTVRISADEYRFDPDRVVVRGPGALRIALRNDGSVAHDIRLRRDGKDVGGTPSFAPGGSMAARVRLKPGTYELLCTVGDHAQLGMRGTLNVRAK